MFPPNDASLRYYANQRIQSHKRRRRPIDYQALLRSTDFQDRVAQVYKLIIPNKFTKVLHPSSDTMSDSDDDDVEGSYHNDGGALVTSFGKFNLGGKNGARTSKSLTPPKSRPSILLRRPALIDGIQVLELVESIRKFDNPCGLYVVFGKTPRATDDGDCSSKFPRRRSS